MTFNQGRELLTAVRLFGCCLQDYTKTTDQIYMKLDDEMGHGPRKNPKKFGADPEKGGGVRITFFNNVRWNAFGIIRENNLTYLRE